MRTAALLIAGSLLFASCGGASKGRPDDMTGESAEVEAEEEALADAPCGNPEWEQLPPGSDPVEP